MALPKPRGAASSSRSRVYAYNRLPLSRSSSTDSNDSGSALRRTHSHDAMKTAKNSLGMTRAYWLATIVCMAGLLFGYDSGIVGGVLVFDSFNRDFGVEDKDKARVASLCVGVQQLGAFVACFLVWPVTEKIGRRYSLMISSFIFCVGATFQTVNTHSLVAFYFGRVVAGLGLGAASVVVAMFNSEMAPKEIRGQVGSFFQFFFTIGIFTSYWVDYAISKTIPSSPRQWQIPIGLQLVPAGLLGFGMLTLPESARWLAKKDRHEEAWRSLSWVRADTSTTTEAEMDEIRSGVEAELREREGFQLKELLQIQNGNLKRVWTAFIVFMAQQATGATAFAYFGPQYFSLLVSDDESDLLLTAIFGAIKVASCCFFVVFMAERISRRTVLIYGAIFMAACQTICAFVVKTMPPPSDGGVTSAGISTVALIYLFVIAYNLSWGPLPWPYVSEIFPSRIREPGIAVGVSSQWLFNFVFSITTPYMIANLGWGTFLLWGLFDFVIAFCTFLFLRETRGLSLEEIAHSGFKARGRDPAKRSLENDASGESGNIVNRTASSKVNEE